MSFVFCVQFLMFVFLFLNQRLLWHLNVQQTCASRLVKGWSILPARRLYTEILQPGTACKNLPCYNLQRCVYTHSNIYLFCVYIAQIQLAVTTGSPCTTIRKQPLMQIMMSLIIQTKLVHFQRSNSMDCINNFSGKRGCSNNWQNCQKIRCVITQLTQTHYIFTLLVAITIGQSIEGRMIVDIL